MPHFFLAFRANTLKTFQFGLGQRTALSATAFPRREPGGFAAEPKLVSNCEYETGLERPQKHHTPKYTSVSNPIANVNTTK
jgi:hypothetical protein